MPRGMITRVAPRRATVFRIAAPGYRSPMDDDRQGHPEKQGLPGEPDQNHEEHEPTEPVRKPAGQPDGGDSDSGGESGEGSQSTGNPDSAG